MKFEGKTVEVSDMDSTILITGYLDPVKNLFVVTCGSEAAEKQKVQRMLMKGFASVAGRRVETEYKRIVRPIALSVAQHNAVNAYNIEYMSALISYLHATAGFPVNETWLATINKG